MISAFGVALILKTVAQVIWGPEAIPFESLLPSGSFMVGGMQIYIRAIIIPLCSLAVVVIMQFVLQKTKMGLGTRDIMQDIQTSSLMGIPTNTIIPSLLSLMGYAITGDSQPTKMLVSNAFRDVYAQKKIDCGVLSRTLDIAGFGEGIFPWTVGGTYFATLFNVSVGRYWYLVFFYYFAIAFNVHTVGRLKSKRYSL